jgi:RHS repeat-associated protein
MQYQYDGLFNRASKTVSGTTTKYLVDPNGFLPQAIAEMDGSGNITGYYVYDGVGLIAKMTSQSVHFYHYDGIGNTIAMTDASGTMVNKYAYDEFGNLLNSVEAVSNSFLYVGQYGVMDEDNGLLYMRARYYDPVVGRFISKDPIGYWGGINLYAYVANNPINFVDPFGLHWLPDPRGGVIPHRHDGPDGPITIVNPRDPGAWPGDPRHTRDGECEGGCDWGKFTECLLQVWAMRRNEAGACITICAIAIATRAPGAIVACGICVGGGGFFVWDCYRKACE